MTKIAKLLVLAVLAATVACKKKIGTSEAVKADLKNYLTVELPKSATLLKLLGTVSEKYKESEGGSGGPREKSDDENAILADGTVGLQKVTLNTEDVKRVHAQLQQGVVKLEASFKKMAILEKKDDAMTAMAGVFSVLKDVIKGVKLVNEWNEDLEAGCKANGLEQEYKDFQEKYGLKAK